MQGNSGFGNLLTLGTLIRDARGPLETSARSTHFMGRVEWGGGYGGDPARTHHGRHIYRRPRRNSYAMTICDV